MEKLPNDILNQIYSYDDTYKEIFDLVILEIKIRSKRQRLQINLINLLYEYVKDDINKIEEIFDFIII